MRKIHPSHLYCTGKLICPSRPHGTGQIPNWAKHLRFSKLFPYLFCPQLDNYEIKPGKTLRIKISVPNLRLFVGNIPKSKGKEEILEEFGKLTGKVSRMNYTEYWSLFFGLWVRGAWCGPLWVPRLSRSPPLPPLAALYRPLPPLTAPTAVSSHCARFGRPRAARPRPLAILPTNCSCSWMIMKFERGKRLALRFPLTITVYSWGISPRIEIGTICLRSLLGTHVSPCRIHN